MARPWIADAALRYWNRNRRAWDRGRIRSRGAWELMSVRAAATRRSRRHARSCAFAAVEGWCRPLIGTTNTTTCACFLAGCRLGLDCPARLASGGSVLRVQQGRQDWRRRRRRRQRQRQRQRQQQAMAAAVAAASWLGAWRSMAQQGLPHRHSSLAICSTAVPRRIPERGWRHQHRRQRQQQQQQQQQGQKHITAASLQAGRRRPGPRGGIERAGGRARPHARAIEL
jgi:hypothetical protein